MKTAALNLQEELVEIDQTALDNLKAQVHGRILIPGDADYDDSRKIWNSMIDRSPALIVECLGTADVLYAVRFAKQHQLLISVRGGGHNIAGRALYNNVLLIDLSQMRSVHVDPDEMVATVAAGATLADVDHETQAYGLAIPTGINSTTGIAGLTLGGGLGWLSRSLGMTVDTLISIEAITVDGERLVSNRNHHPDLFWAVTGGGGNFAIITSFKFKLNPVGPKVICGPVIYDIANAKEVFSNYQAFCSSCPEVATAWAVIRKCPPFPFIKNSDHGKLAIVILGFYNGSLEDGTRVLSKLKNLSKPLGDDLGPHFFKDFQQLFDPLLTPGERNYWKSHNFKELNDEFFDTLTQYAFNLPTDDSEIFVQQMAGMSNKVSGEATAYPHRDIGFVMNVHTRWHEELNDKKCILWARDFYNAVKPFATGGVYVNYVSEGDDSIERAYAHNGKKLAAIKSKYDPRNILRFNLNITPSI